MAGRVLLVSPNPEARDQMEYWLRKSGFITDAVAAFEDARVRLSAVSPDVLVTDARLGDYNGLHLVIVGRNRRPALGAVVIGAPDSVLDREAELQGASYLEEPVSEQSLVALVTMVLQEVGRQRRWPRKHVADRVDAEFNQSTGRIVDLSYGGLRLEVNGADAHAPEPGVDFRVNLPAYGLSVDAALVWVERDPSGHFQCGAALADLDPAAANRWRQVVDQVGFSVQ